VSWQRVRAIVIRHYYVLRRSPHRWFDVAVWPVVDTLLFGSIGVYAASRPGAGRATVALLLAGILLFHVIYQSQIAVSVGFMEETWSRNLLNLMTTPLKEVEYLAGVALFGLCKLAIGIGVVALCCWALFSFDITDAGWGLLPVAACLLAVGWAISLFVVGLILRFGQGAEVLAWGLMFIVMPLSGVFYPPEALPGIFEHVARLLPTTHAFAAGRALVEGRPLPWGDLGLAVAGTAVATAAGLVFLLRMLHTFRARGYVTRFS
jgi:ABC-2 type transport system permease protein